MGKLWLNKNGFGLFFGKSVWMVLKWREVAGCCVGWGVKLYSLSRCMKQQQEMLY